MNISKIISFLENNSLVHNSSKMEIMLNKYSTTKDANIKNSIDNSIEIFTGYNIKSLIIISDKYVSSEKGEYMTIQKENYNLLKSKLNELSIENENLKETNKELRDNYWNLHKSVNNIN